MLAHNVVIVTSGRVTAVSAGQLDSLILSIIKLKKNPILVLGPDGDDLLGMTEHIEKCEIIFDPNFEGGLFSGIKAGLSTTSGNAFICALNEPNFDFEKWSELERKLFTEDVKTVHVFQPVTHNSDYRFPCLVTSQGVRKIQTLPANSDWEKIESLCRMTVSLDSQAFGADPAP